MAQFVAVVCSFVLMCLGLCVGRVVCTVWYMLSLLWFCLLACLICYILCPLPSLLFPSPTPHSLLSTHTGAEVDRIKKNYLESQSRRTTQLRGLNDELQGVQKIMFENIDAVLQRGELITGEHFSNNLVPE